MVSLLLRMAEHKQATPAQIALAYLPAQKPFIVPIPGTRKLERVEENVNAAQVMLNDEDLAEIEAAASNITVQGERLPEKIFQLPYR
jgi:aryl-alcohol dehydrogenase-like predicted oxidoreductase